MSTLERHCRLLLRVYPAAYRDVRAEEIIGTLLEATPPGRSWPRPRDIRGLIFGGVRARAALNRQFTTAANLRIALLAGVAAYLAYNAAAVVSVAVLAAVSAGGQIQPEPFGWPMLLSSALILLTVGLALLVGRRAVLLAAAVPAAAVVFMAGPWSRGVLGLAAAHLLFLAALVALAGGSKRPNRRWLVLIGLIAVLPLVPDIGAQFGLVTFGALLLTIGAVSIVWAVIDARPVIAVSVFFLALWLAAAVNDLILGFSAAFDEPDLGIVTVVGLAALWLLRRQSAHPGRPMRTP